MTPPASRRLALIADRLRSYSPRTEDHDPSLRWAAVALVLVPAPDAILLIRRAERSGDPWSGHMALPGGRLGPGDADLVDAAIRETLEEVGVVLSRTALRGSLDDVAPRTPVLPPVAVRPYVFELAARPSLVLNEEVAAAAWVPLDLLAHPTTYGEVRVRIHRGELTVPAYQYEDAVVWGMTERILSGFFDVAGRM